MIELAALLVPLLAAGAPSGPAAAGGIPVTVSTATPLGAIDPRIYGVNFGDAAQHARLRFPLRRLGGNAQTRYSWRLDASNRGSDWFFMNVPNDTADVGALPDGSAADVFVAETLAGGGEPVVQLPLIGWTPRSRAKAWGFSVAKYGAQAATECTETGYASWCNADAGNGVSAGGGPITGNDPADTSEAIAEPFVTDWIAHLTGRFGAAAAGGVRLYALDNEPALWSSTHRDVHPSPVTYDELWSRTASYAAAIKAAEPGARLLGPVAWGWCEYFHSAADGCAPGADQAAHGGVPLLAWYLDQVCAFQRAHGVRLVDYLDVHYYPQGGTALTTDETAATAALRLRALRELHDPVYVSESWIDQPVGLIPRLRALVADHCPGIGLSVSEYNLGDGDGASAVLAQAEALAIFGRERLDLAARWVAPPAGSRLEDAFALYLDYDGAGSRVVGDALAVISGDQQRLGAYAVRADAGRLLVLLFNEDTAPASAAVSVDHELAGAAAVYGFEADTRLGARGAVATAGTTLTVEVPARSARLVVATLRTTPPGGGGGGCQSGGAGALALGGLLLGALAARRPRRR